MKRINAQILLKTYETYIKVAKEYAAKADISEFSAKVFVSDGRYLSTPPLLYIKLRDFGDPFRNLYITHEGELWIREEYFKNEKYRAYCNNDHKVLYQRMTQKCDPPLFRFKEFDYDVISVLCLLSFFHQEEQPDENGDFYTVFYSDMPRTQEDIEANIMKRLSNK